jgi:type IV secretory pathway VirB4 component
MELLSKKKGTGSSTQRYVDVEEIRDGVIVLKNGALRSVLLVSSINFELKSSEEQDAIIAQYQNFLNSLDFPVQIVIQSRRFNIDPYISLLRAKESQQTNELLRFQMKEYQNFIKNLTEISNIMSKYFYVVVPFSAVENEQAGLFQKLGDIFNQKRTVGLPDELFDTYRTQLMQRVDHCMAGLSPIGLRATALGTEEIIELLYNSYNPSLFTTSVVKNTQAIELEG